MDFQLDRCKVAYITSRGGTVPIRKLYMDSVGADYQFVDHKLRWHDVHTFAWKKYLSWIVCAATFPGRDNYDIFISSGQHYMPILMKWMRLLGKEQKVVCYQGNETLFFLKSGKYSKLTTKALRWQLRQYDAHICLSKLQAQLLREVVGNDIVYYCIFNGVEEDKFARFKVIEPNLNRFNILFIGNLYVGWRLWYKGIDILLSVFQKLKNEFPEAHLTIVGQVTKPIMNNLQQTYSVELLNSVHFAGKVDNLGPYIAQSAIYLHLARGEAFGSAVIEAMAGGLIPIVSEWTGAKEVVEKINKNLVVSLDVEEAYQKIRYIWELPYKEKEKISKACRALILKEYTIKKAINRFQEVINDIWKTD